MDAYGVWDGRIIDNSRFIDSYLFYLLIVEIGNVLISG